MKTSVAEFCDVLSIEDWAYDMVPKVRDHLFRFTIVILCVCQPVYAVLFVYPIKDDTAATAITSTVRDGIFYMRQTIANACGTIAILHAIGNCRDRSSLVEPNSFCNMLFSQTAKLDLGAPASANAIADIIERSTELETLHNDTGSSGQSSVPDDAFTDNHFICFSEVNGKLYELDGRKNGPVDHGECSSDDLLPRACEVIKKEFMEKDSAEIRFTILALAAPPASE